MNNKVEIPCGFLHMNLNSSSQFTATQFPSLLSVAFRTTQFRDSFFTLEMNALSENGSTLQKNFNGSKTFGAMKICSRQRLFELVSVTHCARSWGIIGISFLFNFL